MDRVGGRLAALAGALVLAVGAAVLAVAPAQGYVGAPWFQPDQPYDQNFADPAILEVDGVYHAYATTTGGPSLPVMTSTDLVTWIARGDALGAGPSWSPKVAGQTALWAPTVVELPDGSFMAAFAAKTGVGERRCIATAYSTSPLGPFAAASDEPFVCEPDPNGAIDPFLVIDGGGVPWLIWKNEGVPVGYPGLKSRRTAFWSRELSNDGRSWRAGSSTNFLIETTELARPWQGTVIENPSVIAHSGEWLLFYSANEWRSAAYAIGYAKCSSPGGPCVEPSKNPVATSDGERLGPGAPAPLRGVDGKLLLGYHAWNPPYTDYPAFPSCDFNNDGECSDQGQRFLFIDRVCVARINGFLFEEDGRGFCDVPVDSYYGDAVRWLADQGITTGVSADVYGSVDGVTRGQMATFLWRLMGAPPPSGTQPFDDVEPGSFYGDAVAWLHGEGLTTGIAPRVFSPDGLMTRAEMATFLWRLMGSAVVDGATPFGDVKAGLWYSDAVAWLADRDITTGTAATSFSPAGIVTRAQMAAFLCRLTSTLDYYGSGALTPIC